MKSGNDYPELKVVIIPRKLVAFAFTITILTIVSILPIDLPYLGLVSSISITTIWAIFYHRRVIDGLKAVRNRILELSIEWKLFLTGATAGIILVVLMLYEGTPTNLRSQIQKVLPQIASGLIVFLIGLPIKSGRKQKRHQTIPLGVDPKTIPAGEQEEILRYEAKEGMVKSIDLAWRGGILPPNQTGVVSADLPQLLVSIDGMEPVPWSFPRGPGASEGPSRFINYDMVNSEYSARFGVQNDYRKCLLLSIHNKYPKPIEIWGTVFIQQSI